MPESLEICAAIESNGEFRRPLPKPFSGRTDSNGWLVKMADIISRLIHVRHIRAPLPEFSFADAREDFMRKYPLENPASYDENFALSEVLVKKLPEGFVELEGMVFSKEFCTEGGISYDDMVLFARLRTLTIVKGLIFPKRILEYVEYQAERADIPLMYYCAIQYEMRRNSLANTLHVIFHKYRHNTCTCAVWRYVYSTTEN